MVDSNIYNHVQKKEWQLIQRHNNLYIKNKIQESREGVVLQAKGQSDQSGLALVNELYSKSKLARDSNVINQYLSDGLKINTDLGGDLKAT